MGLLTCFVKTSDAIYPKDLPFFTARRVSEGFRSINQHQRISRSRIGL